MKEKLIKLPENVAEFIMNNGSCVYTNDEEYYYMPMWFKKTDVKDVMEEFSFDCLPKELTVAIKRMRLGLEDNKE